MNLIKDKIKQVPKQLPDKIKEYINDFPYLTFVFAQSIVLDHYLNKVFLYTREKFGWGDSTILLFIEMTVQFLCIFLLRDISRTIFSVEKKGRPQIIFMTYFVQKHLKNKMITLAKILTEKLP
jgi:hypothetical protein